MCCSRFPTCKYIGCCCCCCCCCGVVRTAIPVVVDCVTPSRARRRQAVVLVLQRQKNTTRKRRMKKIRGVTMLTARRQPRPLPVALFVPFFTTSQSVLHFLSSSQHCPVEQSPFELHDFPSQELRHCLSLSTPQQDSPDPQW